MQEPHRTNRPVTLTVVTAIVLLSTFTAAGRAAVTVYPTKIGQQDDLYRVTAGGKAVPVAKFWKGFRMARFAMSGRTQITISLADSSIKQYTVHPAWVKASPRMEDGKLILTLDEPADVRVRLNDDRPLALFAYEPHAAPEGENVVDMAKEPSIDRTGEGDMTAAIQKAIDRVSEAGGGTLYFPAGVYGGAKDATLHVRSNITMHLDPGAVIRQIRFMIENAENINLQGHGILDFTGAPGTNQQGCLRGNDTRHVSIRDLISLNFDYNWNTRFDRSEHVTITNYRIFGGKDGIDPVDSRHVTIRNVYIVTKDDCIAVKSFRQRRGKRTREVSHILAENCLLECIKYGGVKIGTETNAQAIHHVTYRNIEVVSAQRAAIIQLRDGAEIHDILIENLTAHFTHGRAIDFVIQKRRGLGRIHDVTVRNCRLHKLAGRDKPRIAGYDAEHRITDVTFEGLVIEGNAITSPDQAGFETAHTHNIRFVPAK